MGLFQRLDFLLVLIIFGVESINYLQTEGDDRIEIGEKNALINSFNIKSIILQRKEEKKINTALEVLQKSIPITSEEKYVPCPRQSFKFTAAAEKIFILYIWKQNKKLDFWLI